MEPLFQIKLTCPCCEATFQSSRVRPSFKKAVRNDTDFCPHYKTVNPDYYIVRLCPLCGFASTESFTDKLSAKQKTTYYAKIGTHWKPRDYGGERTDSQAMECFKRCLLCAQAVEQRDRVIAGLLHHIAWLYRWQGNQEQENRFLAYALESYIRVFETERDAISNARIMYLIGELHRRLGEYHKAVRWFRRVIQDPTITDASMIRASREMWQSIREQMIQAGVELPEEMRFNGA